MDPFWMGVRADAKTARVLVHAGPHPVLKARLPAVPQHPRALETLAEGVALWYNRPLSVALAVDAAEALSASPRHAFFAARPFSSVADLNTQLASWIAEVAHARPVPGRREQRVADALAEEQPRLLPLPEHPFPCDLLRTVSSGKTPYVRFDGNDHSIPHTLVRRPLTLVAAEHQVRLLDGTLEVARHARRDDRDQRVEDDAHLAALLAAKRHAHDLRPRSPATGLPPGRRLPRDPRRVRPAARQ